MCSQPIRVGPGASIVSLIVLLSRSEERSDTMSDQLSVFLKVSLPNVIYDTRFEKPIRWDVFA
ncbi:hypothetical protein D8S78_24785 [Natrialba swarupiae]|nr:hypothetical protein [Natrialba swarupiae]